MQISNQLIYALVSLLVVAVLGSFAYEQAWVSTHSKEGGPSSNTTPVSVVDRRKRSESSHEDERREKREEIELGDADEERKEPENMELTPAEFTNTSSAESNDTTTSAGKEENETANSTETESTMALAKRASGSKEGTTETPELESTTEPEPPFETGTTETTERATRTGRASSSHKRPPKTGQNRGPVTGGGNTKSPDNEPHP